MVSRLHSRPRPGLLKWIGLVLVVGLAACSSRVAAPSGAGLCWRMFEAADGRPDFRTIAREVPNLESCAAQLEGARMMEGAPTTGAYNGHFIFATEDQITSATELDGVRIRIFEAEDRRRVQAGLRVLIEHRDAQAPPGTGTE